MAIRPNFRSDVPMIITSQIPGDSSGISVAIPSDGVTADSLGGILKGAIPIIKKIFGGGDDPIRPRAPFDPFGGPEPQTDPCPGGFRIPGTDRCFETPFVPRGPTGTGVTVVEDVQQGVFGLLSTVPEVVGEINGRPILRCGIPGLVLGTDNRCYSKKDLPNKLRKWPKRKTLCATDRKIKAIKDAGAAAKSLTSTFKGSGFKISRTK